LIDCNKTNTYLEQTEHHLSSSNIDLIVGKQVDIHMSENPVLCSVRWKKELLDHCLSRRQFTI